MALLSRAAGLSVLLAGCFGWPSNAQVASRPLAPEDARAQLRVDAALVQIPVHVTTLAGATVAGLKVENFRLYEDGVEQTVTHFAQDDAPVSVAILFDSSGSMQNKIRECSEAAASFLHESNREDEFLLIEFSDRPKLVAPFTEDADEIYRHIAHTRPFGRTSLLDAIHAALAEMKNARHLRKAIVIFSDGGDNRSRFSQREIKAAMRETDVNLYAIGIFDRGLQKGTPEEKNGPALLEELAEQTGGHLYTATNLNDLNPISTQISKELRNQYLLGYTPSNGSRDGKYRRVKVVLIPPPGEPPLQVHFRLGYSMSVQ